MTGRCTLICCAFDRERANRGPGRRNLTPLYSPAAATRDAVAGVTNSPAVTTRDVTAGGSTTEKERSAGYPTGRGVRQGLADAAAAQLPPQTSSVCHGDTVPEPVGRLGDVVTLDALRRSGGVS